MTYTEQLANMIALSSYFGQHCQSTKKIKRAVKLGHHKYIPDMRKGADAGTLSVEVLIDCSNFTPESFTFTLISNAFYMKMSQAPSYHSRQRMGLWGRYSLFAKCSTCSSPGPWVPCLIPCPPSAKLS